MKIGIITVSDRCSRGESDDRSGPALEELFKSHAQFQNASIIRGIIPDEKEQIENRVIEMADRLGCQLIVTSGGTGFAKRDITPDTVAPLLTKQAPGIVHAMMSYSLTKTPVAWLSRPVAGVRNECIIITVPGSPKAAVECITPLIENSLIHAIELASGDQKDAHPAAASANQAPGCNCSSGPARRRDPALAASTAVADRARHSEYDMVPMDDALKQIETLSCDPSKRVVVEVPTHDAVGKILAKDVVSTFNHPPFRASIKDGYAVVAADGAGTYPVVGSLVAGSYPEDFSLQPGQIARVNTGGPVPPGADAVIQVEDTELVERTDAGEEKTVKITKSVASGNDIRPIGCDLTTGGIALKAGCTIRAPEVGLALSVGAETVHVYAPPTVAVVSTGDELIDRKTFGDGIPPAGKIFDSNRAMLLAACSTEGHPIVDGGIAADNMKATRDVILAALDKADVVLTSGGVSMGEVDCVKKVLLELGGTIHFGRVNMKPGKPTTFVQLEHKGKNKFVFGLPGNPVSAMVCFHLFVVPALRGLGGLSPKLASIRATLKHSVRLDPERPEYHRCFLTNNGDGTFTAQSTGVQASHRLMSLSGANGLMVLPAAVGEKRTTDAGAVVEVIVIAPLPPA